MENNNMINSSIKELKQKFIKIKMVPYHKSLRKGSTGIGYTFETLIGKKEDSSFEPDFKGIEIKTKIGYTKCPLTLFSLTGTKDNGHSIYNKFIYYYGYNRESKNGDRIFSHEVYANKFIEIKYSLLWRLKIDYKEKKIKLLIMNRDYEIVENEIYWKFNDIKNRLLTKLKYLALVKGYPYKKQGEIYYRYVSMTIYKLKSFDKFMELIERGIICIVFNISGYNVGDRIITKQRKIEFRMNFNAIDELFEKID